MSTLDWLILIASLAGIVGYGLYRGRGSKTVHDYLLAGKTMRWWVIGLSIMATQAGAITFIGTTGLGYGDGLRFVQFYFGMPIAMVIISAVAVPFFHHSGVYTAYEYLEQRFDAKTRILASLIFLVQRGLGVGLALYAPAVVLSAILGWPEAFTILAMGVVVVGYTTLGGIRAVMWTDVQQMTVMFFGIVASLVAAIAALPAEVSFPDALELAGAAGRLRAVDLSFDWENRYNLWSGLIGGAFLAMSYFGCDQSQVQRYLTGSSIAQMRISLLFNAVVKVPLQFLILLTGALVFVFFLFEEPPMLFDNVERDRMTRAEDASFESAQARYREAFGARRQAALSLLRPDEPGARAAFSAAQDRLLDARREGIAAVEKSRGGEAYDDTNYVFLNFVLKYLPTGLVGLIIAAVFAAAMSSISSELNALAAVTVIDHYQRYVRRGAADPHYARVAKLATVFWGLYAMAFAGFAGQLGALIEAVNLVGSFFYGSLLGAFVLAFGPWRANGNGAFSGMLAGLAAVAWISVSTEISYLWYNVVGCVVAVVVGLAVSRGGRDKQQTS